MVGVGVVVQSILGTALALFFNLHLRGRWLVRGLLVLPMLLTPVVVGLMWRALLNPDWGLVNWMLGGLGFDAPPNWLGDPAVAKWVLIFVDVWQWTPFVFIIVFARLQALPDEIFEAAAVDGAGPWGRLDPDHPAAAGAGDRLRRRSSGRSTPSARSTSSTA